MLNLIADAWIPVRRIDCDGREWRDVIRPDQIAEPDVMFPDWPRADMNLACLELLIGLVFLACPPDTDDEDEFEWLEERPDADELRTNMARLAPAFNLLGDGPRFLQDFEPLSGSPNSPEMLFIDSAGASTAKKNADLMVKRDRYLALELPLAAMALYTLQNFAPSGGAGNRTSMRGGGPMVTLVKPIEDGLWPLIWANTPAGIPLNAEDLHLLPWMRKTVVSENGVSVQQPDPEFHPTPPEMFFGQPRRLQLVAEDGLITGVIQRPNGTNYQGWLHALSPYYHNKTEWLPKHPKPGLFGYRNWGGVAYVKEKTRVASVVHRWGDKENRGLIVGGWAMSNMTPLDFQWSEIPLFQLNDAAQKAAENMVLAADLVASNLAGTVATSMGEGDRNAGAGLRAKEALYTETEHVFVYLLSDLKGDLSEVQGREWQTKLRTAAATIFDREVTGKLGDFPSRQRDKAVKARRMLHAMLNGHTNNGAKMFDHLGIPRPSKSKRKTQEETT